MTRPLAVDQIARAIFNNAAIAVGTRDAELALQVCTDLGAIERDYRLALRCEPARTASPSTSEHGSTFCGRMIATKFAAQCKVCRAPIAAGAEVIWQKGVGVACVACGEIET